MGIGRTESFQELINIMESLFQETIIGSDINIVRHLFYYLKIDNKEFEFIYENEVLAAAVDNIVGDTVELMIPEYTELGSSRARIKFEAMNVQYQFEVVMIEIHPPVITIKIPTELQSYQLRTNRRILVDDLFMNFTILFRSLSGGSREIGKNLNAESRFPHLMKEIRKDKPDIKLINRMATEAIQSISKDYTMIFFKDTDFSSELEDMIKEIMQNSGKSIYIPDCNQLNSYIDEVKKESLTNYSSMLKKMAVVEGRESAVDFFETIRKSESREFLVSYVISPIRLYDDIIGYVKAYSTAMDRFTISSAQAHYIHELAEIFSYALTKVAIQYGSYDTMQSTTRVVDISLDGLLFEIQDPRLFKYLKRHSIIKMKVPLSAEHVFTAKGEIVRFLDKGDYYLLGVNYFKTEPDDMLHLEDYLFQKSANIISG